MTRCPHCGSTHAPENHFCPVSGQPIDLGPRLIKQRLLERFNVVTILGEGPISIVLEVEDIHSKTHYAAKLIHPQYTRNSESEKLLTDAKKSSTLDCPNLAKVIKVGRDAGAALTVVRELMTGKCLEELLGEKEKLPIEQAVKITKEILTGLDALHKAEMVNLDLSPSDVFLAKEGDEEIAKLVDLGEHHIKVALIMESKDTFESSQYYAPEQFDKSRQQNHKADLYAAGAIFYRMIAGVVPSGDTETDGAMYEVAGVELSKIIKKSVSSNPAARFDSAADFKAALEAFEKGEELVDKNAAPEPEDEVKEEKVQVSMPEEEPAKKESSKKESEQPKEQASVIVDMPEIHKGSGFVKSTGFKVVIAVVILAIVGIVIYTSSGSGQGDGEQGETIKLTVEVDPLSAIVTVDGKRIEGNPLVVDVPKDEKVHTVRAKAEGYETVERDVEFDAPKTVSLALIEIIQPEDLEPKPEEPVEEVKDAAVEELIEEIVEEPVEETPPPPPAPKPKPQTKPKPKPKPKPETEKKPRPPKPDKPDKSREGFSTENPFG